jgi:hypothetical protein
VPKIAPAMGEPINDAVAPTACAMPSLVPSTFGSGQTTGKIVGGKGMRAPEKKPANSMSVSYPPIVGMCLP